MGVPLDPKAAELHNLVVRDGRLRVRPGLITVASTGSTYVGGFSVESPTTTEVWHYLFERSDSGFVTLSVTTEEFSPVFSVSLGKMPASPVFSYGLMANQILINSPSLPTPLYGLVGGGLIPAYKVASEIVDTTALDIPNGHVAAFGGRLAIANGNSIYVSDPGVEPRTFVAQNILPLGGTVNDLFEGPDGGLWIFTSTDVYVLPADALGAGQQIQPFLTTVPGVQTTRPRNAAASLGGVMALTREGLASVSLAGTTPFDVAPYRGRRFYTPPIEVDDYRLAGRIFPTARGFVVGFGGVRSFWLEVDVVSGFRSYVWTSSATALNLVGTLRTRDGETLYVTQSRVLHAFGTAEFDGSPVRGLACARLDLPADSSSVARFVTVAADNVGQPTRTFVGGTAGTVTTPAKSSDVVIGTSLWSASARFAGRESRTVRHALAARLTDLQVEIGADGAGRELEVADVDMRGQGRSRRDRS